jgi:hypothetical protein
VSSLQQVARILEKPTGIPFPTIKRHIADLRTERLIAASKRGMGANLATSGDAIKILLGTLLTPTTVVRALGLLPAFAASEAHDTLPEATDAYYRATLAVGVPRGGLLETLVGILDALRAGAWSEAEQHDISVELYNGGEGATVTLFPPGRRNSLHMTFGFSAGEPIDRIIRIRGRVLRDLANLLGPLPAAIPPPAP